MTISKGGTIFELSKSGVQQEWKWLQLRPMRCVLRAYFSTVQWSFAQGGMFISSCCLKGTTMQDSSGKLFFLKKKPCWMCGSRRMHPIMMDPLRFHSFWGDSSGTWLQKTFSFWSADKWEFLLRGAMWSHCFFKATRFSGAMKRLSDNWSSGISIQLFLLCRFCSA